MNINDWDGAPYWDVTMYGDLGDYNSIGYAPFSNATGVAPAPYVPTPVVPISPQLQPVKPKPTPPPPAPTPVVKMSAPIGGGGGGGAPAEEDVAPAPVKEEPKKEGMSSTTKLGYILLAGVAVIWFMSNKKK